MTSWISPDLFAKGPQSWPFGRLHPQHYGLIVADPPWRFELYSDAGQEKSPQVHYATMTLDDIKTLPVADLAAADCVLWLWATAPMLPQQLAVMAAWGFEFRTSGTWVKTTVNDKIAFGTGYILRNAHEPYLIGVRGEPKTSRSVRSVVMGQRREHSRKPELAYADAEQLVPNVARCELFSRTKRTGWDVWGNETGKFDEVGAIA